MKARAFERWLQKQGATMAKTDGDHHVWRLPNGRTMVVPTGGGHSEAPRYLERRFYKLMGNEKPRER